MAKDSYQAAREKMIHWQLIRRGVVDRRLLDVMEKIPRHLFVPPDSRENAYEDRPLPIGDGQTISQPYIVALMTSLLDLQGSETVLEIGTGSGYQAAILGRLAKQVHSVERNLALARQAQATLHEIGIDNVIIHPADGSLGWPDAAPYEAIIVTAAAPSVPELLLTQLADGGRLVIPVGTRSRQSLELWQREGEEYTHRSVLPVTFVPLIGKHGWAEDKWR
ncbi:MAG: protein-L-isoaspartate(D-aspartate) O-methyltransferase [Anaerolineaceae bacterium]|jgi:protein-L-isoaspartate(D-aspartate) O-methyltransferase|nr:protein-L-isoaspartate(D-aspartate) O-methyltransferase [Anaerolineaceae bacterium]